MVSPTSPAKAPIFAIVIHEKGGSERREVFESTEITVGRVQGNDLMLPKGNVSKRHARLLYREGRFIVTDLNSTNGTYVNRRRITQATIVREGDRIYVGDFVLRIESPGAAAEQSASIAVTSPPPPRAQQPSVVDSQPAAALRSAFDEDEEFTRSASRGTKSNPAATPEPTPGRATQDPAPGRVTQDDEDSFETAERDAVAALVERVARGLRIEQFEKEVSPEAAARVDHQLREAWGALAGERPTLVPLPPDRILEAARSELLELGPLTAYLADPSVGEIAAFGRERLTLTRAGKPAAAGTAFSSEQSFRWAVARLCARSGQPLGNASRVDRRLADGTSISAALSPGGIPILIIRKPRRLSGSLDELVRRGTVSRALATFLQQCLLARVNILVVGPRDGSLELLLGALASAVPEQQVVYAGDFEPASGRSAHRMPLEGTPEDVARGVGLAARAPMLRLLVELGSPPVTEAVIDAIADGADGVIAARCASSLGRGFLRVRAELGSRTDDAARALLAGAFEVVVEIARLRDDRHRVLRVAEVVDSGDGSMEFCDVFTFVMDRTAAGGMIEGSFVPAGTMPAIAEMMRSRGASIDSSLFSRPPSR